MGGTDEFLGDTECENWLREIESRGRLFHRDGRSATCQGVSAQSGADKCDPKILFVRGVCCIYWLRKMKEIKLWSDLRDTKWQPRLDNEKYKYIKTELKTVVITWCQYAQELSAEAVHAPVNLWYASLTPRSRRQPGHQRPTVRLLPPPDWLSLIEPCIHLMHQLLHRLVSLQQDIWIKYCWWPVNNQFEQSMTSLNSL